MIGPVAFSYSLTALECECVDIVSEICIASVVLPHPALAVIHKNSDPSLWNQAWNFEFVKIQLHVCFDRLDVCVMFSARV